jgi:hypothetical protein
MQLGHLIGRRVPEMSKITAVLLLLAAAPLAAQIQSRRTDPPIVTAVNETWYQLREPIQFAGDLYYPAGPTVFFNGNIMVRTGHYNGVPLYADTTLEPYSVVLVPVSRGLMQPYERLRRGDLAGTTASRAPSFPVRLPTERTLPQAPTAPTGAPLSTGAIGVASDETVVATVGRVETNNTRIARRAAPDNEGNERPVGTVGRTFSAGTGVAPNTPMVTLRRPQGNDGIWIHFAGEKWVSAGAALPIDAAAFRVVGQYAGFPVYAREDRENTIYLPTRAGLVTPYRLK